MTLLSKDQILGADDLPTRDVEVPEWGGTVRVRGLTGKERDNLEVQNAIARKIGTDIDARGATVGRCMLDEHGNRLFTDREVGALGRKSAAPLDRLFDVVRDMSGMTDEDLKRAAEDFDRGPSGDSPSA